MAYVCILSHWAIALNKKKFIKQKCCIDTAQFVLLNMISFYVCLYMSQAFERRKNIEKKHHLPFIVSPIIYNYFPFFYIDYNIAPNTLH